MILVLFYWMWRGAKNNKFLGLSKWNNGDLWKMISSTRICCKSQSQAEHSRYNGALHQPLLCDFLGWLHLQFLVVATRHEPCNQSGPHSTWVKWIFNGNWKRSTSTPSFFLFPPSSHPCSLPFPFFLISFPSFFPSLPPSGYYFGFNNNAFVG